MAFQVPSTKSECLSALVRSLLRSDRQWVRAQTLAEETGMSRASVYRWITLLEAAGWPLERDVDRVGHTRKNRGFRSLLIGKQREHSSMQATP